MWEDFHVLLIALLISAIIGAILWPYTINIWLIYFGKQPIFTWYYGAILGFIPAIRQLTIPLAIITWIAMIFLA